MYMLYMHAHCSTVTAKINVCIVLFSCRTTMILHVPNTSDRTTLYRVETDIEFITGPSTMSIVGNDVADYPIMIEPLTRGNYTGAIVFSVESRSGRIR